jgi:hypothetical protein
MGGPANAPVRIGDYRSGPSNVFARGVPGVPETGEIRVGHLASKSRALVPGLMFRVFNGYFNDDVTFFDRATETHTGVTTSIVDIGVGTNGIRPVNGAENYSVEWYGYFYAPVTGTWTFYTNSDDASYLWVGAAAQSGYTVANATVNNGGQHGMVERSGTFSMTAGTFYPIRVQYGESGGGDNCQVSFMTPAGQRVTDGLNYYFCGLGTSAAFSAMNARTLRAITGSDVNRSYWLNVNGSNTPTVCLMDGVWDGGGWMLMLKATQSDTFGFDSTHWTSATTLNATDVTRDNADAKYDAFNHMLVKDVLALWPDVGRPGGLSGSVSTGSSEPWSWLVRDFYSSNAVNMRANLITGLAAGNSRDSSTASNPRSFAGFNSTIWSSQLPAERHVFGGGSHLGASSRARWGFLFNENSPTDFGTMDAYGGIGMGGMVGFSAGDRYACCGVMALNRRMRVELYGR